MQPMEDLLPEIALNIFYYIPFRIGLKTVALVCKKWHDLLKVTKNSKLMTVDLKNINNSTSNIKIIARKYNIEQLVISHLGDSIYPLVAILSASPALHTLVIGRLDNGGLFQDMIWQDMPFPRFFLKEKARMPPKLPTFSNIKRLIVPSQSISLLHLFPNVQQLKFDMLEAIMWNEIFGPFESVKEIEARIDVHEELSPEILKEAFPNLETLYLIYQPSPRQQEEEWQEIENKCKGIVTVHCRNFITFPRSLNYQFSEQTYAEYYFNHGETPLVTMLKRRVTAQNVEEFLQRHSFLTAEYESDLSSRDREVVFPSNSEVYEVNPVTLPPLLKSLPAEIQDTLRQHGVIPPAMLKERPTPANDSVKPMAQFTNQSNQSNQPTSAAVTWTAKKDDDEDDEAEKFWKRFGEILLKLTPSELIDHVAMIQDYPIRHHQDMRIFAKFLYQMSFHKDLFTEIIDEVLGEETFAKLINTQTAHGTIVHYLLAYNLDIWWSLVIDFIDWSLEDGSGLNIATSAFIHKNYIFCSKAMSLGATLQMDRIFSTSYIDFYSAQLSPAQRPALKNEDVKKWIFSCIIREKHLENVAKVEGLIQKLGLSKKDILTLMNMHLTADQFQLIFHLKDDYQIDINEKDNNDNITLQLAIDAKNIQAVYFALSYGADPNLEITKGMTPLVYLCNMKINGDQDEIFYHLAMDALVAVGANVSQIYVDQQKEKLILSQVAQRAGNPFQSIVHYMD